MGCEEWLVVHLVLVWYIPVVQLYNPSEDSEAARKDKLGLGWPRFQDPMVSGCPSLACGNSVATRGLLG